MADTPTAEELAQRVRELEKEAVHREGAQAALQDALGKADQHGAETAALLECSRAVLRYREFNEAARHIFDASKKLIGATTGYVSLSDPYGSENKALFVDVGGLPCDVDPDLTMPIRGLLAQAYHLRKPIYDNDFSYSPWMKEVPQGHIRLDNVLFAPLVIDEKAHGLLGLANKPGGFTDSDARMAAAFGEFGAIALLNSRTLEAFESSEERLRSIVETAVDGIVSIDSAGRIVSWNSGAEGLFGYPLEEVIGRPFKMMMPERFWVGHEKGLQRIASGNGSKFSGKTVEMAGLKKSGQEFPVELSLATWESKDGRFFTGIIRDISERKQAQERVGEQFGFLQKLMDAIPIPVFYKDSNGLYTGCNNAYAGFLGLAKEEIVGRGVYDIFAKEQADTYCRVEEKLFNNPGTQCYETQMDHADGSRRHVSLSEATFLDRKGEVGGVIGAVIDITERKRAEEEKRRLGDELRQAQKVEAIGTLAGGIAHDFNNILASIMGYGELALDDAPKGSPLDNNLQQIFQAGRRAKDLVNQILTFSRQGDEERRPVQMAPLINEALKLLRSSLPATVDIREQIETDLDNVLADPTQIHQIVMNLCANASHAMRKNGGILEVNLRQVEVDPDSIAEHSGITPGPYVRLTVSDTGHGMPRETLERIFEPYFTTKEKGEGTGMGLSVVHGIVRSYEGTITVYSEPGNGTTFNVYLPAIKGRVEAQQQARAPLPTGRECILFVDDEPPLADLGKQKLRRLGYEVTTRTSSVEALELYKAKPDAFDLVITDMTMPQMTGDRLASEMMKVRPDIPVILCTGYSTQISKEKAKGLGIRGFAMKPIVTRELAEMVRQVLDGKEEGEADRGPWMP
ncbi:MAG: PAS domain S-box protein [Thermodesulfobacteriota bacterium]|nr:PAS domain S-box protein [Thermodesulfobacteriota bacterium]